MEIRCLGSSSKGNCYLLVGKSETLILEAGVPFFEVKKALGFNLSSIVGALVTHKHKDHAKSIVNLLQNGIKTISTKEAFEKGSPFAIIGQSKKGIQLGNFKIIPLAVCHDCECFGYLIQHPECGKLGFFTDTYDIPFIIPQLDYLMIESNYSKKILDENLYSGKIHGALRERIIHSHYSFDNALLKIKEQRNLNAVVLLHLSKENSDGEEFISRTERETGIPTYAAHNGFTLKLSA